MTLRAAALLALAILGIHEVGDVFATDDHASAGHHVLLAVPGLLAMALAVLLGRARRLLVHAAPLRPDLRLQVVGPSALLVLIAAPLAVARGLARNLAGRAPPAFG